MDLRAKALLALLLVCTMSSGEVAADVVQLLDLSSLSPDTVSPDLRSTQGIEEMATNASNKTGSASNKTDVTADADKAAAQVIAKAAKDPVVQQEDAKIVAAKKAVADADNWSQRQKHARKQGCPCPGRDFHINSVTTPTPATKATNLTSDITQNKNVTQVDVADVGALVRHYVQKLSHFSSWKKHNDEELEHTRKQLKLATIDSKSKLKGAMDDFERLKIDPQFKDWNQDMCPCPTEDGYEEMMTAYMKARTPSSSVTLKKDWYKEVLEVYKKRMKEEETEELKAQEEAMVRKQDEAAKMAKEVDAAKKQTPGTLRDLLEE